MSEYNEWAGRTTATVAMLPAVPDAAFLVVVE
jgi:hypothetical protein